MNNVVKENEMLREAIHLYVEESAGKYDFDSKDTHRFSQKFEKRMERLIKQRRKPWYCLFNTVTKKVACVVIAMIVVAVGAVVGVEAFRGGSGYTIKRHFNYAYAKFKCDGDEPSVIKTFYGPAYIPEGYELSDAVRNTTFYKKKYKNSEGNIISYSQSVLSPSETVLLDTNIEEKEKGFVIYSESDRSYFWSDGKYKYRLLVYNSISEEEMMKIADSLKDEQFVGPF